MDARVATHHDDLVGQGGNISSTGRASTEDRRDLRQPRGRHIGLAIKRIAEVPRVRKNAVLFGKVGATAIHQIEARHTIFRRDLLRADMFLHRLVIERAALHRRIVGDEHAGQIVDNPDACDDPGTGNLTAVLPIGRQRRQLKAVPGSTSRSIRSRTNSLARLRWRATMSGRPPPVASAIRWRRVSTRSLCAA